MWQVSRLRLNSRAHYSHHCNADNECSDKQPDNTQRRRSHEQTARQCFNCGHVVDLVKSWKTFDENDASEQHEDDRMVWRRC